MCFVCFVFFFTAYKKPTSLSTFRHAVGQVFELDVDGRPLGQMGEGDRRPLVHLTRARPRVILNFSRQHTARAGAGRVTVRRRGTIAAAVQVVLRASVT